MTKATKTALLNVRNYHGDKAAEAYRSGDEDSYCRHIAIADRLWAAVNNSPG